MSRAWCRRMHRWCCSGWWGLASGRRSLTIQRSGALWGFGSDGQDPRRNRDLAIARSGRPGPPVDTMWVDVACSVFCPHHSVTSRSIREPSALPPPVARAGGGRCPNPATSRTRHLRTESPRGGGRTWPELRPETFLVLGHRCRAPVAACGLGRQDRRAGTDDLIVGWACTTITSSLRGTCCRLPWSRSKLAARQGDAGSNFGDQDLSWTSRTSPEDQFAAGVAGGVPMIHSGSRLVPRAPRAFSGGIVTRPSDIRLMARERLSR